MRVCSIFGDCRQCHAVRRTCAVPRISCRCAFSPDHQQLLCLLISFDLQWRQGAGEGPHAMACCSVPTTCCLNLLPCACVRLSFVCLLCSGGKRRGRTPRQWRWRRRPASGSECCCPYGVQLLLHLRWRVSVCVHRGRRPASGLLAVCAAAAWVAGWWNCMCSCCRPPMPACCPASRFAPPTAPRPHPSSALLPCRCRHCTYANEDMEAQACEVCGQPRRGASQR